MNAFAFISLISTLFCLALGLMVFLINRKATLNKLFFLTVTFRLYLFVHDGYDVELAKR